jgi:hypothetical protein
VANEVMRVLSFTIEGQADADGVVEFEALEDMTIVGASLCAEAFTGSPTAFDVDVQDDGTDVITALTASTAGTPGTWKTAHMGGTEDVVHIAAGSSVEVDVNLTAGSSPTADFTLLIYYLAGAQG